VVCFAPASADSLVAKAAGTKAEIFIANGSFADGVLTIRAMKALQYNPKALFQSVGCIIPAWVKFRWPIFEKGQWEYLPPKQHPFSNFSLHDYNFNLDYSTETKI
jgi:hypothetical protein